MEVWFKISLLLCVFGFLKEIRPSEPFVYNYLIDHRWRNVTESEVTKQVYPVGTYSHVIILVLVFLITDICRYKPLIIVLGLAGLATWALLIWTTSLLGLQLVEVMYGVFSATEVAYFTYIYAKVDKEHFQKVTSHTRGALLAGRCISGITAQTLVSTELLDLKELNYITFTTIGTATIWAFLLPSVRQSLYFHTSSTQDRPIWDKFQAAFKLMYTQVVTAFTNFHVIKWSIWWALSTCGDIQVAIYIQPLYAAVLNFQSTPYNGAVEAIVTLLGFLTTIGAGYLNWNWNVKGDILLGLFSLVQGALIVLMSQAENIYLCYAFYIIFALLYFFMVTIASSEIAKNIHEDSYGLIFGILTFVAQIFNTILTALFATEGIGFSFEIRDQFIAYGTYHLVIALIFLVIGVKTLFFRKKTSAVAKMQES